MIRSLRHSGGATALLRGFKPQRTAVGLEVDGRFIRAVQLVRKNGRLALEAAVTLERQEAERELQASDVRRLAGVLDRQGFTGSAVNLVLPANLQLTGLLELPPADSGAPVAQLAKMELARMHRCEAGAIEMAFWNLPARRRGADGSQVMATGCRLSDAEQLLDRFAGEHLDIRTIDVPAWSMCRACMPLLNGKNTAIVLNVGWECCTTVLMHEGIPAYERIMPDAGVRALHAQLVKALELSAAQVDALIRDLAESARVGKASSEEPQAADRQALALIASHFAPLVREVAISSSYVSQRYDNIEFETLVLVGPGADLPGLQQQITESLGVSVRVARPDQVAECPSRLSSQASDPGLMMAIGMAMYTEE